MSNEVIMIVDEDDRPVGTATKQETWEKGLLHRIVRVIVEDGRGNVLLQKRAPTKKPHPNSWDCSSAGHVDPGESYMVAAKRELDEELGLTNVELQEIATFRSSHTREGYTLNRVNRVYKAVVSPDVKPRIHKDEVSEAKWFELDDAKKLTLDHPDQCTFGLSYVMQHYF